MSQIVAIRRGNQTVLIERLTECEECHRWFTVTVGIELVPGKPFLQLCVRDFLTSIQHRVKNPDAATGDGGNSVTVAGSSESLANSRLCVDQDPVAASKPAPKRRKKAPS